MPPVFFCGMQRLFGALSDNSSTAFDKRCDHPEKSADSADTDPATKAPDRAGKGRADCPAQEEDTDEETIQTCLCFRPQAGSMIFLGLHGC